jgi:hypothetical protein
MPAGALFGLGVAVLSAAPRWCSSSKRVAFLAGPLVRDHEPDGGIGTEKECSLAGATFTFDNGFSPIFIGYLCKVGLYLGQALDNSQWPAAVVQGLCKVDRYLAQIRWKTRGKRVVQGEIGGNDALLYCALLAGTPADQNG